MVMVSVPVLTPVSGNVPGSTSRFVVKGAGRTGQDSDGHCVDGSWLWLVYIRLKRCSQLSLEVRFRRCWCYLCWARCSIKDNARELSAIK
jgi:hypothetical protein